MSKTRLSVFICLFILPVLSRVEAQSKPAVYEGFTSYEHPLARQGEPEGSGWKEPWSGKAKWGTVEDAGSTAEIAEENLKAPRGYSYLPEANRGKGEAHIRNFAGGMVRPLQKPIALNEDGIHYISFLWSQSGSGQFGTMQIALLADKTHSWKPFVFTTQSATFYLQTANAEHTLGQKDFTPREPYLLVAKLVTYEDPDKPDMIFAHIWNSEEERLSGEPELWQMYGPLPEKNRNSALNRFFANGSPNNFQKLDEIRIGSSFEAVTGRK